MHDLLEAEGRKYGAIRIPDRALRVFARTGPISRLVAMALGLAISWAASEAWSHTGGIALPPESRYLVRWFQPHGVRPVSNWEVEVTPTRNPTRRFIATAQVMPDASCWALNVPVAEPAAVRVRSVSGTQVSAWTRPTTVPEPGPTVGILSSAGLLLGLFAPQRRRSRSASIESRLDLG